MRITITIDIDDRPEPNAPAPAPERPEPRPNGSGWEQYREFAGTSFASTPKTNSELNQERYERAAHAAITEVAERAERGRIAAAEFEIWASNQRAILQANQMLTDAKIAHERAQALAAAAALASSNFSKGPENAS